MSSSIDHRVGEPYCDCADCRAMSSFRLRGQWQAARNVGLEWMDESKKLRTQLAVSKTETDKFVECLAATQKELAAEKAAREKAEGEPDFARDAIVAANERWTSACKRAEKAEAALQKATDQCHEISRVLDKEHPDWNDKRDEAIRVLRSLYHSTLADWHIYLHSEGEQRIRAQKAEAELAEVKKYAASLHRRDKMLRAGRKHHMNTIKRLLRTLRDVHNEEEHARAKAAIAAVRKLKEAEHEQA